MSEVKIVVGQRGWVHVGYWHVEGETVVLENARCIRRWGTPGRGLAALVNGPLPETELEEPATMRMHQLAMVHSYDCDAEAWREHLS